MSEAERNLDALAGRVSRGNARVLVEKAGVPVAGLVSAEDLKRLDRLDREGAKRSRVIDEARAAFGDVSPDKTDRRVLRHAQRLKGEGTTVVPPHLRQQLRLLRRATGLPLSTRLL